MGLALASAENADGNVDDGGSSESRAEKPNKSDDFEERGKGVELSQGSEIPQRVRWVVRQAHEIIQVFPFVPPRTAPDRRVPQGQRHKAQHMKVLLAGSNRVATTASCSSGVSWGSALGPGFHSSVS